MRASMLAGWLVAVAVAAADASAQDVFRTTDDRSGVWLNYGGEHSIGERASFLFDLSIRRGDFASVWRTLLVRPGVQWELTPGVRVAGGYTFSYVYPAGSQNGRFHTPEHRIFQQISLSHVLGDVGLTHRYRFENRWFGQHDTTTNSGEIDGWLKRQRFRYQVKATLPLGDSRTYLTAFDEIFINMGANVRYNVLDQNRFAAGLGVRLTPALRLETYYLNYLVLHSDGRGVDRNHVWMTVLNSTHSLRRNARR
ncbi:MAG: DUF2490 domain-containing protein [Gemmatimonadaceae bacterium]